VTAAPALGGEAEGDQFRMIQPIGETAIVHRELDIRGEVCPFTFVKTKLALEGLQPGQVLRVMVDNGESGENVPRSLMQDGHQVLDVSKLNATDWAILVRKA
jgi:TusA-related sulfurtransferase